MLDLSKATKKQLDTIEKLRVYRGCIVVTRSGSIGRVSMITQQFDGIIASDDLIRLIIPDEELRLYIYFYLQSKYAQDQMKMNEYGSIQQHLEPYHVAEILIPIPNEPIDLKEFNYSSINFLEYLEKSQISRDKAQSILDNTIGQLVKKK